MLQHEKLKTLQQITGLVINFFQNNQNFTSGKQSTSQHTDLTSNQTDPELNASYQSLFLFNTCSLIEENSVCFHHIPYIHFYF
jgi:type II secretory pathway component HofQ